MRSVQNMQFVCALCAPGGRGYSKKKLGRGVRPASQNPYPIYDQNSRKTIPFGAAHTYIAHTREYPPPPLGLCKSSIQDNAYGYGAGYTHKHKMTSPPFFKIYLSIFFFKLLLELLLEKKTKRLLAFNFSFSLLFCHKKKRTNANYYYLNTNGEEAHGKPPGL